VKTVATGAAFPRSPFDEFSKIYSPKIDLSIEKYLEEKKKSAPYEIAADMYALFREFCLRGGKRVRPLLLLNAYLGYARGPRRTAAIVRLAAVLEIIHAMFLVQDDVIDRSPVRRGGGALHRIFQERYGGFTANANIGNDIAVVAADVLFAGALDALAGAAVDLRVKNEFLRMLGMTIESTAWGQILDVMNTRSLDADVKEETALTISTLKTAYYTVYYPMLMGHALAGGGGRSEKKRIRDFALPLGLAFQLRDDILGVFGNAGDTGKSVDSDLAEGKLTYLIQNTLQSLGPRARSRFQAVLRKERKGSREIGFLRRTIRGSGALSRTGRKFKELTGLSRERIKFLGMRPRALEVLSGVIDLIEEVDFDTQGITSDE
jgi:geranylgeranyl diphosphate synthase, type I